MDTGALDHGPSWRPASSVRRVGPSGRPQSAPPREDDAHGRNHARTPSAGLTACRPCTTPVRTLDTFCRERIARTNRDSASPCHRHVRNEAAPIARRSTLLRARGHGAREARSRWDPRIDLHRVHRAGQARPINGMCTAVRLLGAVAIFRSPPLTGKVERRPWRSRTDSEEPTPAHQQGACICLRGLRRLASPNARAGWLHAAQRLSRVKEQCPKAPLTR
jgi:hypothetical protein